MDITNNNKNNQSIINKLKKLWSYQVLITSGAFREITINRSVSELNLNK